MQFLFANTVSLSSLRVILPCHYSLFRRQYEALYVIVREVLLTFALIQPTLRWFSPFHQLSPTHFFLCSCTIWLIKVIPTPSFYTSSLPPIASHYQPIRNFLTFKIPLIPYPFNFSSLPFQPPISSPFNFTVLSCSASFFHLFCPIINYRVFIPHPSHFANLLLFI